MPRIKTAVFGQFIKTEREKHGWTQTEFGAKIGINAFTISKIENGFQKFSKSKLKSLADLLNIKEQLIIDLFYADKFATEALKNHCSDDVFTVAKDNIKQLKFLQ